jgi:hypothetical protein
VHAITLGNDGTPLGGPIAISGGEADAGQGQPFVTASGRGAVAFLEATDVGFRLMATPIDCSGHD